MATCSQPADTLPSPAGEEGHERGEARHDEAQTSRGASRRGRRRERYRSADTTGNRASRARDPTGKTIGWSGASCHRDPRGAFGPLPPSLPLSLLLPLRGIFFDAGDACEDGLRRVRLRLRYMRCKTLADGRWNTTKTAAQQCGADDHVAHVASREELLTPISTLAA